ncbi:SNF2 family N-terminal domain-containing protein [Lipomyces kononenkoae]|uniref:SNF2 family N-terminal domain-containing protein n=1 Tax=Lipomyces kononenkoae TaxID=34357 RepID=A0ACC3T6V6_LIPKO
MTMETSSPTAATLNGQRREEGSDTGSAELPTPPATSSPEPISEEQRLFNALDNEKKLARLRFLIERSKVYSSILSDRLLQQQQEKAKAEALAEKRTHPKEEKPKSAIVSSSVETRHRGTAKPADKISPIKSPSKLRSKSKHASYSIADYLSTDDLGSAKNTSEALREARTEEHKDAKPLSHPLSASARQPSLVTGGVLKDYQLAGVEWLISLYENGLNGILADEMGLGKTLQTIAFLAFLREKGSFGPFLIVAPLSTLTNWVSEIERFTPSIPALLYHGTPEERADMRDRVLFKKISEKYPLVVTSYNIVMNDRNLLRKLQWKYIIIDEGHRIKNMNCKLIKELKSYDSANRLLLTGTPLQNNLAELWSLLNFLLPDIFHDLELFQSWFDFSALERENGPQEIIDEENRSNIVSNLHAILKPFLLRRMKSDVEYSLPPKREYVLYAPMTATQQEFYRHLLAHDMKDYLQERIMESSGTKRKSGSGRRGGQNKKIKVDAGTLIVSSPSSSESDGVGHVRKSKRRAARKTAGKYKELSDRDYFKELEHPEQFVDIYPSPSDDDEEEHAREVVKASKAVNNKKLQNLIMQLRLVCDSPHLFYNPWDDPHSKVEVPDESIVNDSGKMLLMDRLVPELFKRGHKVLIFSQFRNMLDIIQDWAEILRGWKVCRLDGQVKQEDRKLAIDNFNSNPKYKLFLLSTRAGGLGINLSSADTVILFDSDWNPQQDLQAMDRAHRIGQTKPVIVYRLATANTVEQTMLEKADAKRQLEKLVIQKGKFRSLVSTSGNTEDEIATLLLGDSGLEKFVVKEKGDVILSDEELHVLLDRSDEAYSRANRQDQGQGLFRIVDTAHSGKADVLG